VLPVFLIFLQICLYLKSELHFLNRLHSFYSLTQLLPGTKLASTDNSVQLLNEKDIVLGAGNDNAEIGKVMTLVRLVKSD